MITTRRTFVKALASGVALVLTGGAWSAPSVPLMRTIPSSGEKLPAVGLGSWITFNVGDDPVLRDECAEVIKAFFAGGGRMIDSSPMYGSSQPVIGYGLEKLGRPETLFSAEKVWTSSAEGGRDQIEQSRRYWGVSRFDLMQVHNLVAWEAHLETLFAMKAEGRIRYVGITTSEGRRHDLFEEIMRTKPLDFVQLTYNIIDREAEERLLPLAAERGIAVIVNRPFQQGEKAKMPTRCSAGVALVHDGLIYVAGGRPPHGNEFAVYDPAADRWETLPDLPSQRNHIAGAVINGRIHVIGGRLGGGFRSEQSAAHEVYDPETRKWTSAAAMLRPRSGVNGVLANGCLHAWGGESAKGMFPDHDYYDPRSDKWTKLSDMPVPVHGVTGAAFVNGLIHAPGGGTDVGGTSGSLHNQAYRPAVSCQ